MTDCRKSKWNIKKLVLFKGAVETLSYFSERLAETFQRLGYQIYIFDMKNKSEDFMELYWYCEAYETALVTFNFIGLSGEKVFQVNDSETFWNQRNVLCLNIVVDHPLYYHKALLNPPLNYIQFCIDRLHVQYMRRFYPGVLNVSFLPLAGTQIREDYLPYEKRQMDLLFTGNYTEPVKFEQYITGSGKEYELFYRSIIAKLMDQTDTPIEKVIEDQMREELGNVSNENIRDCMKNMIFIDLYIRFYYRGFLIKTLVESGFKVHVFGDGWDKLACNNKENLILGGSIDSLTCIKHMRNAKISLNIMPWFKDGAHDRILNTMLSKAVCLTDSSIYLNEQFTNGKELEMYSLDKISEIPMITNNLLEHSDLAEEIAERGFVKAKKYHTWEHRANVLNEYLKSYE